MDLSATSVHVLDCLTLFSPYNVSSLLLASAANLSLTMHPTPVTLCVIRDLFQFLLAQIAVLWCISAPEIALFTRFSLVQLYSVPPKEAGGLMNLEGALHKTFGRDGLTLHPNNLLSGVNSKASKPAIALGACRHRSPN